MMPEVMGMELHRALSESPPQQAERMTFVAGGAFTSGGKDFRDAVPNPRIEKPFEAANVRALVRGLLPKRRG